MADGVPDRDDAARIEELLRVNAELAAEIRSLTLGRASAPRSGAVPTARRLGKLEAEREGAEARLVEARAELAAVRAELERLEQHNRDLGRQIHEQSIELERLRAGPGGFLRRARARLFGRAGR